MQTASGPAHIVMLGNAVKEVVGEENVKIYKMRDNSIAPLHVATCCMGTMCVRHPEPGPNAFPCPAQCNKIICDDEEVKVENTVARVFTCDADQKKHPDVCPLPAYSGTEAYGKGQLATSGFVFKFLNRTKKKVPNVEGDRSLEEIEAAIKQRDGDPTVIGAV